jgi:ABC-type phosphate transport system auxiliary subunit
MKREARRSSRPLSAGELAQWRTLAQAVDTEEAEEIIELGRQHRRLSEALKLLRRERERQGLSLADVQQRTGIDRSALSRLETATEPNPTFNTLQRYANALGKEFVVALVDRP